MCCTSVPRNAEGDGRRVQEINLCCVLACFWKMESGLEEQDMCTLVFDLDLTAESSKVQNHRQIILAFLMDVQ